MNQYQRLLNPRFVYDIKTNQFTIIPTIAVIFPVDRGTWKWALVFQWLRFRCRVAFGWRR